MRRFAFMFCVTLFITGSFFAQNEARINRKAESLVIGETFSINSKVLNESRRMNVYVPSGYSDSKSLRLPVLYMPDGGIAEDFLHIAGLVQVSVGNGTMRPFLLVGIENTQRRRDMTGPTLNENDKKIAPQVGGSAAFRKFIRDELMPEVNKRYRTTGETAIVGESLTGLFVLETLVLQPDLFDTYIAFDPSLWWNDEKLIQIARSSLAKKLEGKTLYLASSGEKGVADLTQKFETAIAASILGARRHHEVMQDETHATIYHPAALKAFRLVLGHKRQK
ncbi:MAG: alpha/beta hydrolase [Pyrinomonadaceae bacterium]